MTSVLNAEKRRSPRARLSWPARVRPSQPTADEFDEVLVTSNSSRGGCYFTTDNARYRAHLRVFVMVPYSDVLGAINRDYVGEIVRVDKLEDGRRGIAINLLTPISLSHKSQVTTPETDFSMKLGRIG